MSDEPLNDYDNANDKGSVVTGKVKEVDARNVVVLLANEIEGTMRASEISRDKVSDARTILNEGDEVEVKIIGVDRKNRTINLSIKARELDDEKDAMRDLRKQEVETAGPSTIGDLIKAQMEDKDK